MTLVYTNQSTFIAYFLKRNDESTVGLLERGIMLMQSSKGGAQDNL